MSNCIFCGKELRKKGNIKYCSLQCRVEAYKIRRRGSESESLYRKKKADERREAINQIKLEKGCKVCGYKKHPGALHFNHINPKEKSFNVSGNVRRSWEDTVKEIEKCEVLCANCHAELTYSEGHHKLRKSHL